LPAEHQALFNARIALQQNDKSAGKLIDKVSKKHQLDSGLLYDRMRYRARKSDEDGVRQILLSVPKDAAYPEKWWKHREVAVRDAINKGNYKDAAKLASAHDKLEGADLAAALWLDGWIALEFLRESQRALTLFSRMHDVVKIP